MTHLVQTGRVLFSSGEGSVDFTLVGHGAFAISAATATQDGRQVGNLHITRNPTDTNIQITLNNVLWDPRAQAFLDASRDMASFNASMLAINFNNRWRVGRIAPVGVPIRSVNNQPETTNLQVQNSGRFYKSRDETKIDLSDSAQSVGGSSPSASSWIVVEYDGDAALNASDMVRLSGGGRNSDYRVREGAHLYKVNHPEASFDQAQLTPRALTGVKLTVIRGIPMERAA